MIKKIKGYLDRFKQWQQSPSVHLSFSDEEHTCMNCGHTFTGRYCPSCGQSAKVTSRLTWASMLSGTMDVWGLGSHSMLRNALHLFLRPGYLISDYLQGRRQQYFSPFKMMFLVTALLMLLRHLSGSEVNMSYDEEIDATHNAAIVVAQFLEEHRGLFMLMLAALMACFLRLFFSFSPRMGKINLCECVFTQVWIICQSMMIQIICEIFRLVTDVPPFDSFSIIYLFFLITYKQLFGYSWWSTLWRTTLLVVLTAFILFSTILATIFLMAPEYAT